MRSLERLLPPTLPAPTRKHINKATNIIYTHVNIHTDNEISEKDKITKAATNIFILKRFDTY